VLTGDRGSVVLLLPAALLIVLVLGVLSVDMARVAEQRRSYEAIASAVANDAVTAAVVVEDVYDGGGYVVDPQAARRLADRTQAALGRGEVTITVSVPAPDTVTVTVTGPAPDAFIDAFPTAAWPDTITTTATATAEQA
jgi:hypothetical protein